MKCFSFLEVKRNVPAWSHVTLIYFVYNTFLQTLWGWTSERWPSQPTSPSGSFSLRHLSRARARATRSALLVQFGVALSPSMKAPRRTENYLRMILMFVAEVDPDVPLFTGSAPDCTWSAKLLLHMFSFDEQDFTFCCVLELSSADSRAVVSADDALLSRSFWKRRDGELDEYLTLSCWLFH